MKTLVFILLAIPCFAQLDTALIWHGVDPMRVINKDLKIITTQPIPVFLEVPAGKKYEIQITFKQLKDTLTRIVDNTDPAILYTTWTAATGSGFYNSTYHWAFASASVFELTFTGHKIEWFSERNASHGRAGVTIDGGPEELIPAVIPGRAPGIDNVTGKASFVKTFAPGVHKIKIRVVDVNKAVLSDYFKIYYTQ